MTSHRLLPFLLPLLLSLGGCASVSVPRDVTQAIPASQSAFGRSVQRQAEAYDGRSGFRLLPNSNEAFRARAELIRNAQSSIDLQYYIVADGLSTRALVHELLAAADRGVRVRILLDDTASDGQDGLIGTLAAHPNIQIRVFNPLQLGRATGITRAMGRLFNLSRQHRRMHNKLWLVDNSMAIVGGRNIGDAYFDAEPNLNFTDIDLLGVGPVAEQLGHSFDQYWNSALSKPIGDFLYSQPDAADLRASRQHLEKYLAEARSQRTALYDRLMAYQTEPRLDVWRNELIWAHGQALWDAPSKVLADDEPDPQLLMTRQLAPELNGVRKELILISAYFVPREQGLLYLTSRADAGVQVDLLTNALEATDVPVVHGGYAPYRRALLEHGVKLFELRRQPGDHSQPRYRFSGASDSSLHSKAIVFDRQKTFIGSFNFDPRSVLWNTEVGVLVDSPELAQYTRDLAIQGMAPAVAYQVELQDGKLVWVTEDNGQRHVLTTEPGGLWRRFNAWIAKAVGLEKML